MSTNKTAIKESSSSSQVSPLFEEIPGVLFRMTKSAEGDLKFEEVSSQIEELSTLTAEKFLQLKNPIHDYVHQEDLQGLLLQIDSSFKYRTRFEWQGRIKVHQKVKWVHIKARPFKKENGAISWSGLLIDITLQKFLLDQLLQRKSRQISDEKINSLNQMASGIAHEINTPLTTARMNMEIIKTQIEKSSLNNDSLKKCFERFDHACQKITKVIGHLRDLSRNNMDGKNYSIQNLNEIVRGCIDNVSQLFSESHHIEIKTQICEHPLMIQAHEAKLNQAILNLMSNAKDAVAQQNPAVIEISTFSTPVYNYLKIKDNGIGIPKDSLAKVFEPFYTTKHKNLNPGVGLSLSNTILTEHHAIIDISSININENAESHGTEITIKFPIAAEFQKSA